MQSSMKYSEEHLLIVHILLISGTGLLIPSSSSFFDSYLLCVLCPFEVYSSEISRRLGAKHVKGVLLFGPPGTGKTLMARQIGKMLNGKEPKV